MRHLVMTMTMMMVMVMVMVNDDDDGADDGGELVILVGRPSTILCAPLG